MTPFRTYDRWLLFITIILVIFGALMIYSSTSVVTPKKNITSFHYFMRHLFTMLVSFIMMAIAYRVNHDLLRKLSIPLLIFSLILLILVFVPNIGVSAGNARRWIRLWPSTFQPSELVKLGMVLFLARFMSMPQYRTDRFFFFIVPVLVMALFQGIFLFQPDFGAVMSLGILTMSMLFISGTRLKYLMSLLPIAILLIVKLLSTPYRLRRIMAFIDPWKDAQGGGFQLVQSFIAFGSGGLGGVGLGNGRQKLSFLPEVHTDFIFSIVGEELGFIVAVGVVGLFAILIRRGIAITEKNSKEPFLYYLTFGLTMMLGIQALINFFVVTGLAPTKGLPLPFISYGGSALLINMVAVGILLNASMVEEKRIPKPNKLKNLIKMKKARRKVYGGAR